MEKIRALVFAAFMSLSSCVSYPAFAQDAEPKGDCITFQRFDIVSTLQGWTSEEVPKDLGSKILNNYNAGAADPMDFSRTAHVYVGKNSQNFEVIGIAVIDMDGCVTASGVFDLSTFQRFLK